MRAKLYMVGFTSFLAGLAITLAACGGDDGAEPAPAFNPAGSWEVAASTQAELSTLYFDASAKTQVIVDNSALAPEMTPPPAGGKKMVITYDSVDQSVRQGSSDWLKISLGYSAETAISKPATEVLIPECHLIRSGSLGLQFNAAGDQLTFKMIHRYTFVPVDLTVIVPGDAPPMAESYAKCEAFLASTKDILKGGTLTSDAFINLMLKHKGVDLERFEKVRQMNISFLYPATRASVSASASPLVKASSPAQGPAQSDEIVLQLTDDELKTWESGK